MSEAGPLERSGQVMEVPTPHQGVEIPPRFEQIGSTDPIAFLPFFMAFLAVLTFKR